MTDEVFEALVRLEFLIVSTQTSAVRKIELRLRAPSPYPPDNMLFYVPLCTEYDRVAELAVMRFGGILIDHLQEQKIL